jgi:hypothetical protein
MAKRSAKSILSTPAYPFVEAAHYLNVPLSTLRAWCVGQGYPAGMTEKSPNQAGQPHDGFVRYASQDAATANSVVETLELQGITCWIAPRDVTPGSQ